MLIQMGRRQFLRGTAGLTALTATVPGFLHKTGLTWNYAADAGLVEALPGKPPRRYVVVLVSSLGERFVDPERAAAPRHPCTASQVCVDRRLARLGAAIDAFATAAAAREARRQGAPGR